MHTRHNKFHPSFWVKLKQEINLQKIVLLERHNLLTTISEKVQSLYQNKISFWIIIKENKKLIIMMGRNLKIMIKIIKLKQ